MVDHIKRLVDMLPGCYQPIFGHEELSDHAARICRDRLEPIVESCRQLAKQLERNLRILDLGCAQGFFTFNLATEGHEVVGLDIEPANIALCRALAEENPNLRVQFLLGRLEDFLPTLKKGDFDVVLGLSIFHHLCHIYGWKWVRSLISNLVEKIEIFWYEAALREEPLYWAPSLPEDPRLLVDAFPFVHVVSHHTTPLSQIRRPLFFCSARWWFLGGKLEPFLKWANQSDAILGYFRPAGQRKPTNNWDAARYYFLSHNKIAKLYLLRGEFKHDHRDEILREVKALSLFPPVHSRIPKLHGFEIGEEEAWLVREKLAGQPLINLMLTQQYPNATHIVQNILDDLCALESRGLYHRDLRLWNVLILDDGRATLVDYGSVWGERADLAWPHDPFLAFIIFVWEINSATIPDVIRRPFLSSSHFYEPFRSWVRQIWRIPPSKWSFALFREEFIKHVARFEGGSMLSNNDESQNQGEELWRATIERYLAELVETLRAAQSEKDALRQEVSALQARLTELQNERENLLKEIAELRNWLQAIHSSTSWRLTAPLRNAKERIKKLGKLTQKFPLTLAFLSRILRSRLICKFIRWVASKPGPRSLGKKMLTKFPSLRTYARSLLLEASLTPSPEKSLLCSSFTEASMPEAARQIYVELQTELKKRFSRQ